MTRRLALIFVTGALLAVSGTHARADGTVTVVTDSGPVRGVVADGQHKFLGVPYAAPPVGALRWKPPQPPTPWTQPRDASKFGSSCPQNPGFFGTASVNEDCLVLNVYTPRSILPAPLRRDPVMVWIHPGAFQSGEGHAFDPRTFVVERGLVVVTINYRLGAFGFLAHPALTAESPNATSGNYGLLDQQAALRWVKRNIARFGGDPDRVTIAGESAGGVSVHAHMTAPSSAGLFHRAIVQSGGYVLAPPPLAAVQQQHGTLFANAVGCPDQSAACLRSRAVSDLLAGPSSSPIGWLPVIDGQLLSQSFTQAFATGTFNRVPVIEGSTHDEFTLFVALLFDLQGTTVPPPPGYAFAIGAVLGISDPNALAAIAAQYPPSNYGNNPGAALAAVATDAVFACNARAAVQLLAQHVPVWSYEFDDPDAPMGTLPPVSFPYLAFHGSELQYLFGVRRNFPPPPMTPDQLELSDAMSRYWANFTRLATPNGLHTPLWVRYLSSADRIQLLTPPEPEGYTGFAADHKCAFWAALAGGGG